MSEFGPTRGELKFRQIVSLAELCLLTVAVAYRGALSGPALVEVKGVSGYFGGTAIWSVIQPLKGLPDAL